jgi:riboflavin kinase/FMN adenylyltransferase
MSIKVTPLEQVEPRARDVAIGTFDGVHLGHRAVIEGNDTVLTFEPHPLEVLRPEQAPKLINSLEVKRDVLDGLGVEEMVVIRFDEEFSHRSAEEFIDHALIEKLGARRVAVGENFHFGAKARGTPEMLAAHPEFETRIQPMVELDGEPVSSSRVRAEIAARGAASASRT